MNALDGYDRSRARDYARESRPLEIFGCSREELDLRDYFTAPEELPERLEGLDLVWALGGNAFVLARAMTQASFRGAVQEHWHRPEFTYGGYSAGACVAGPDLQGSASSMTRPSCLKAIRRPSHRNTSAWCPTGSFPTGDPNTVTPKARSEPPPTLPRAGCRTTAHATGRR
ncbi:Type 1 glutamine amidotransferase-like domain-containing protein [Streptomyces sp. NPDC001185]|uniref:Type 1 glutamine amidotransferase-like domain-containing protein n=1 Tax=Streptomyces sp. NPDC001185 TaxID=3154380 RepID=UPI003329D4D3